MMYLCDEPEGRVNLQVLLFLLLFLGNVVLFIEFVGVKVFRRTQYAAILQYIL
jgi:hypothetical protein